MAGILAILPMISCSNEELIETSSPVSRENPVRISGRIATELKSRAYQATGNVETGNYYLTYPLASGNSVADVDFEKPGLEGIGIVTNSAGQELLWEMVGGGNNPTMYLDNVDGSLNSDNNTTSTVVTFRQGDNPFVAAVFDSINGYNDLLWGSQVTSRNASKVNFDLHHNMSRIRLIVTADKTNEIVGDELDLTTASKVTLSSIAQTPVSYDRMTGNLNLGEDPEYSTLTIVDNMDATPLIQWQDIQTHETDPSIPESLNIYVSQNIVIPPQELLEDDKRPVLTITTKGGKTFSGILPHAMLEDIPGQENPYPLSLYFLKEHILTLRTTITQEPPELVFMPVEVIEWVDKGSFELEGHQAGIYSSAEFYELVNYYSIGNSYQLERFGYISDETENDGEWVFNFFRSVELDQSEIAGKMKPGESGMLDFSFSLNGFSVTVKNGDTLTSVNATQLYNLVTKGTM